MTQFALPNWLSAKCLGVTKRKEFHGDDLVHAMTIKLRITVNCMQLDQWFGRQARLQWYEDHQSETMPGVEPVTTELRSQMFKGPHKMDYEGVGYVFSMRRGAGHSKAMAVELGGADLKNFLLDPRQGGSTNIDFSVNKSALDEETMGHINGMDGRDIEILAAPPSAQSGTMPDSHAGKGKKGAAKVHSAQGALIVDPADEKTPPDPTGAFLDAQGVKPMSEEPSSAPAPAPKPSGMERAIRANERKVAAKTKGRGPK